MQLLEIPRTWRTLDCEGGRVTKLAIFRRQCIRAKRTLMRRWPRIYSEECFEVADGSDYDVLPGTPMYWTDPYYGEADCRPAVQELRHQIWVEKTDWSRISDEIEWREKYKALELQA